MRIRLHTDPEPGAHAELIALTWDGGFLDGTTIHFNSDLPQAGIRAVCYAGEEPDYATRADENLTGPLVPLTVRLWKELQ